MRAEETTGPPPSRLPQTCTTGNSPFPPPPRESSSSGAMTNTNTDSTGEEEETSVARNGRQGGANGDSPTAPPLKPTTAKRVEVTGGPNGTSGTLPGGMHSPLRRGGVVGGDSVASRLSGAFAAFARGRDNGSPHEEDTRQQTSVGRSILSLSQLSARRGSVLRGGNANTVAVPSDARGVSAAGAGSGGDAGAGGAAPMTTFTTFTGDRRPSFLQIADTPSFSGLTPANHMEQVHRSASPRDPRPVEEGEDDDVARDDSRGEGTPSLTQDTMVPRPPPTTITPRPRRTAVEVARVTELTAVPETGRGTPPAATHTNAAVLAQSPLQTSPTPPATAAQPMPQVLRSGAPSLASSSVANGSAPTHAGQQPMNTSNSNNNNNSSSVSSFAAKKAEEKKLAKQRRKEEKAAKAAEKAAKKAAKAAAKAAKEAEKKRKDSTQSHHSTSLSLLEKLTKSSTPAVPTTTTPPPTTTGAAPTVHPTPGASGAPAEVAKGSTAANASESQPAGKSSYGSRQQQQNSSSAGEDGATTSALTNERSGAEFGDQRVTADSNGAIVEGGNGGGGDGVGATNEAARTRGGSGGDRAEYPSAFHALRPLHGSGGGGGHTPASVERAAATRPMNSSTAADRRKTPKEAKRKLKKEKRRKALAAMSSAERAEFRTLRLKRREEARALKQQQQQQQQLSNPSQEVLPAARCASPHRHRRRSSHGSRGDLDVEDVKLLREAAPSAAPATPPPHAVEQEGKDGRPPVSATSRHSPHGPPAAPQRCNSATPSTGMVPTPPPDSARARGLQFLRRGSVNAATTASAPELHLGGAAVDPSRATPPSSAPHHQALSPSSTEATGADASGTAAAAAASVTSSAKPPPVPPLTAVEEDSGQPARRSSQSTGWTPPVSPNGHLSHSSRPPLYSRGSTPGQGAAPSESMSCSSTTVTSPRKGKVANRAALPQGKPVAGSAAAAAVQLREQKRAKPGEDAAAHSLDSNGGDANASRTLSSHSDRRRRHHHNNDANNHARSPRHGSDQYYSYSHSASYSYSEDYYSSFTGDSEDWTSASYDSASYTTSSSSSVTSYVASTLPLKEGCTVPPPQSAFLDAQQRIAQPQLLQPYAEKAIIHEWNINEGFWGRVETSVVLYPEPFSKGNMRASYYMVDMKRLDCKLVAKRYLKASVEDDQYFDDVSMHSISGHWARLYNTMNPPKKVIFVPAAVLELPHRNPPLILAMEPQLDGTFRKYNNNCGYVPKNARWTPQAFSHFTYHASNHNLMIVDIQGVEDIYTDPQILSPDGEGYGRGNLGMKGIRRFLASHKCNPVCRALGLPHHTPGKNPADSDVLTGGSNVVLNALKEERLPPKIHHKSGQQSPKDTSFGSPTNRGNSTLPPSNGSRPPVSPGAGNQFGSSISRLNAPGSYGSRLPPSTTSNTNNTASSMTPGGGGLPALPNGSMAGAAAVPAPLFLPYANGKHNPKLMRHIRGAVSRQQTGYFSSNPAGMMMMPRYGMSGVLGPGSSSAQLPATPNGFIPSSGNGGGGGGSGSPHVVQGANGPMLVPTPPKVPLFSAVEERPGTRRKEAFKRR